MLTFDTPLGPAGSRPPAPDRLAPLTERVVRGLGRLLRDPGLAPGLRLRLRAHLRFLSALDTGDTPGTAVALTAYLPTVVATVERITPLYLRLHRDLLALVECAAGVSAGPAVGSGAPGSDGASGPTPANRGRSGRGSPAARPGPGWRGWGGGRVVALRLLFGVGAVLVPLVALVAESMADERLGMTLVFGVALSALAAVAGMLARVVIVPGSVPGWLIHRIEPEPSTLAVRVVEAARTAWRPVDPLHPIVEP